MKTMPLLPYFRTLIAVALIFKTGFSFGQGLINNGAHIEITPGAYVYVNGGAAIGNFTNQDAGAFTGIVENQGTMDITGDWNNLSAGNVFNASSGTVRLIGANQFIQGTSSTFFNNLTLQGSGTKTLNVATLTGGGFAAPNGVLDLTTLPLVLNGYKLTVNNPATTAVINTTGYIVSETPAAINPSIVQWNMGATNGVYNYPFGVAGTQIPFTLGKTAGVGNVSVSTRATSLSNNTTWQASVTNMYSAVIAGPGEVPVVIDRWWDVDPSAAVTGQMTFTYRGTENTTTFSPTGTFAAQNWNSFQWLPPVGAGPGVLAGTAAVTTPSQVLSTTPWVLSNLTAPLPIELVDFTATCNPLHGVNIGWVTASESNNELFTIEKSNDGQHFEFFKTVLSKGNGAELRNYSCSDDKPFSNISFYRLSQTDINGRPENLKTISIKNCSGDNDSPVHVWNASHEIHIELSSPVSVQYNALLYDAQGRLIYSDLKNFAAGTSEVLINTSIYSDGIYFLTLRNSNEVLNYKIHTGK